MGLKRDHPCKAPRWPQGRVRCSGVVPEDGLLAAHINARSLQCRLTGEVVTWPPMILTGPGSFPYLIVEFGAAFEHKSSLRINHRAPS